MAKIQKKTSPAKSASNLSVVSNESASGSIRDRINAALGGKARLVLASEAYQPFNIRRPTGITSLDIAMGGGWAACTINQVFGRPGTGKTYLVNETMANVQKNYGSDTRIAVASFGYNYDRDFARTMSGLVLPYSPDEILIYQNYSREFLKRDLNDEELAGMNQSIGEIMFIEAMDLDSPAESVLQAVIEILRSGEFQLVIIDETNMAETKDGASKDMDEADRTADQASLFTKFLKRYYNVSRSTTIDGRQNETTLIEILEVRDKISAMSRGGPSQGGGNALKHAKALDLHLSSWEDMKEGSGENEKVVGKKIEWVLDKAKIGVPEGAAGTIFFRNRKGADKAMDLLFLGEQHGLVVKSGAWWSAGEERLGQGVTNAARALEARPELAAKIREHAVLKAGLRPFRIRSGNEFVNA